MLYAEDDLQNVFLNPVLPCQTSKWSIKRKPLATPRELAKNRIFQQLPFSWLVLGVSIEMA